jgi:hypothetical protein
MNKSKPKFIADLNGPSGNVYVLIGSAQKIAQANGLDWLEIKKELNVATEYNEILEILKKYFDCEFIEG